MVDQTKRRGGSGVRVRGGRGRSTSRIATRRSLRSSSLPSFQDGIGTHSSGGGGSDSLALLCKSVTECFMSKMEKMLESKIETMMEDVLDRYTNTIVSYMDEMETDMNKQSDIFLKILENHEQQVAILERRAKLSRARVSSKASQTSRSSSVSPSPPPSSSSKKPAEKKKSKKVGRKKKAVSTKSSSPPPPAKKKSSCPRLKWAKSTPTKRKMSSAKKEEANTVKRLKKEATASLTEESFDVLADNVIRDVAADLNQSDREAFMADMGMMPSEQGIEAGLTPPSSLPISKTGMLEGNGGGRLPSSLESLCHIASAMSGSPRLNLNSLGENSRDSTSSNGSIGGRQTRAGGKTLRELLESSPLSGLKRTDSATVLP